MPLILQGATSGSTTIQATDATTQTITLPANSGTIITTASSPSFAGNITMTTADTGIVFNKTGALTNSTLNDYEVGTWTSTIGTTGTAFTNSGSTNPNNFYIKIGKFVQLWGGVISTGATSGGTGNVTISGLPFAIDTSFYSNVSAPGAVTLGRVTLTTGYGVFVTTSTATQLLLQYNTSGANPTSVPASAFNGNSSPYFNFSFSYYATA